MLYLVTARDIEIVARIADQLLDEAPDGHGVEVVYEGERLYARGAVPERGAWSQRRPP